MLSLVLYGLLALGLMIGLFLVAARFLPAGEQIAPPLRDEPPWGLPAERHLNAGDIEELRLPVALRGYRFAETDLLLDRLVDELRRRDAELERLYGLLIAMPTPDATPTDATPTDATPADATPADATPADATQTDATPADATQTDATPTEVPPDAAAAEPQTTAVRPRSGPPPAAPAEPE